MRGASHVLVVGAFLAMAGCNRPKAAASSEDDAGDAQAAEPTASVTEPSASAAPVPEPPPIEASPAAPDDAAATKETRERAVLDLLAGGEPATRLPRVVVDPGHEFDEDLRDRVAPLVRIGPPSVRMGAIAVNGRLPPEVVQRIVRQNFGRFRLCYENALRNNPKLSGKVVIKFGIDREGAIGKPTSEGSTVPDQAMIECVRRGFQTLSFPKPEGGVVDVTLPIVFSTQAG
jgi:hypothetical protein